MISTVDFPQT